VPQSVLDKARQVQEQGGMQQLDKLINDLPELLSRNREILDEVCIKKKLKCDSRALQFIPAPTSPWLVRQHFLLSNKIVLLARLIKIPIGTMQLQYVFICT
jgi:hypothetical protein